MGALAAAGGLAFSFVFNKAHNDKSHNSGKHKADNNRWKIPSYPIEHMTFSFHVSVFVKNKIGFCLFYSRICPEDADAMHCAPPSASPSGLGEFIRRTASH